MQTSDFDYHLPLEFIAQTPIEPRHNSRLLVMRCDLGTLEDSQFYKIGTYLKALAAHDNNVPFYVLMPSSSIDFGLYDGQKEILIEERDPEEVTSVRGLYRGEVIPARICPDGTRAGNWGFDITPASLVTGFITERGICSADENSIKEMFSDKIK